MLGVVNNAIRLRLFARLFTGLTIFGDYSV